MHAIRRRWITLVCFAVGSSIAGVSLPARVAAQATVTVSEIKQNPQRWLNREVEIRGQATNVEMSRAGLSQGTFRLIDDTDNQGLLVRTSLELPTVGAVYTVTGAVAQLQENIAAVGLIEHSRKGDRPSWLLAIVIASALAAFVLTVLLVRALRKPEPLPAPIPMPVPAPYPNPLPPLPPQPVQNFDAKTKPMPRTQPFEVSGASVRVVEGPNRDSEVPIGVQEFLIGRTGGRENHLSVADPTVSQAHARIRWDKSNNSFFLVNESTTNKVRLDGAPTEMGELRNGSRIQLGAVTLEFRKMPMSSNGSH
jgi:hypothetical protein